MHSFWSGSRPSLGRVVCRWSASHVSADTETSAAPRRLEGEISPFWTRAGMTIEKPNLAKELALLLILSTVWGASYSFIKVGVETIPPVTLIATRTLIA